MNVKEGSARWRAAAAIVGYGVRSAPGMVVDGTVVRSGGLPSRDKILGWL